MDPTPLYLEPRLDEPLASLVESAEFLHTLTDALGSPLNILLPDQAAANVERFRAVFRRHSLSGEICLAHKATRSSAVVRRLAATGAGIDVASLGELQHALGAGFTGDRIVATGPKDPDFLWLAARTGAVVHLDGLAELDLLAELVRKHGLPRTRVLPRLSGFASAGVRVRSRRSRFGVPAAGLDRLIDALDRHRDAVDPIGTAYHLDTTSLDEKALAFEGCLVALDALRRRGFAPRAVDIGGGFGTGYLADAAQWERYTTELRRAVLGERQPLTWGGHGYGLRAEGGTLRGALGLYPAHRPLSGPDYLDRLLARTAPGLGRGLGALLLDSLGDLRIAPGRALLDQCGLTLAAVAEVRREDSGDTVVRLAAKADDIGLEDHGVLVDPVVVPRAPAADPAPAAVYLTGSLCLESDLITRRLVHLPRLPRPGDLLAFANTAGYCMDFGATRAQGRPGARKVAVHRDAGRWQWCLDDRYWPIGRTGGTPA
ncbi:type III PLP-dependent enzyme domain-containing protein [Streptomonospora mangrovi]|uniref:alanine racemase n=1 Tax=Streptomonospora mangrovi TaxID=2883123 RepID=UPI0022DD2D2A|nr:alanine racemase [Streptomonospora mangrovi]